jgi:hypothetical protein
MMGHTVTMSKSLIANDLTAARTLCLAGGLLGRRLEAWPLGSKKRGRGRGVRYCTQLC